MSLDLLFLEQGSNKGDERVNKSNYLVFKEQGPRCYAIGFLIKVRDVMQLKQSTMSCYLSISVLFIKLYLFPINDEAVSWVNRAFHVNAVPDNEGYEGNTESIGN